MLPINLIATQTIQPIYSRWSEQHTALQPTPSSYSFGFVFTNPNNSLEVDKRSKVITNAKLIDLNEAWEEAFKKYHRYIKEDLESFYQNVKLVNSIISVINYEDFAIELTPNSTIKYSLLLPDKKKLIIKKYFEKYEDKAENDVIFSIFDNKKLILSDTKDLDELVSGINRFIEM